MKESKEFVTATTIIELLDAHEPSEMFDLFEKIHLTISDSELRGIEIYLILEDRLNGKMYHVNELNEGLEKLFLEFSWSEIDLICSNKGISRYDAWKMFSDVIYCIRPILFHYVNEKEFFGTWDYSKKEWTRPF